MFFPSESDIHHCNLYYSLDIHRKFHCLDIKLPSCFLKCLWNSTLLLQNICLISKPFSFFTPLKKCPAGGNFFVSVMIHLHFYLVTFTYCPAAGQFFFIKQCQKTIPTMAFLTNCAYGDTAGGCGVLGVRVWCFRCKVFYFFF